LRRKRLRRRAGWRCKRPALRQLTRCYCVGINYCYLVLLTMCALRREAELARKREAKAKAKAEKRAAASAAKESAAEGSGPAVEAPVTDAAADEPVGAVRRGSVAQMRRTFHTFSLMHLTKVLLDGTLVPEPVEPRHGSAETADETARLGTTETAG
jgi:hypothetical protein